MKSPRSAPPEDEIFATVSSIPLPTKYGTFQIVTITNSQAPDRPHLALLKGNVEAGQPVLVRIHSECFTGDVLASQRCDCGAQLGASLKQIGERGGILFYLMQEGRGIGLAAKLQAYALQDGGMDTYEANEALGFAPDARSYDIAAQFLLDLGVEAVSLLTNNPDKIRALEAHGLIVTRVPLHAGAHPHNEKYLETKRSKFGHLA